MMKKDPIPSTKTDRIKNFLFYFILWSMIIVLIVAYSAALNGA